MAEAVGNPMAPSQARQTAARWLESRLKPQELHLIKRAGSVSYETLPSGARCAKLRFRDKAGRQRVRYLGVDRELARQVGEELQARQQAVRRRRRTKRLVRHGAVQLRETTRRLAPLLNGVGWHFHGRTPRKRRARADGVQHPQPPNVLGYGEPFQMNNPLTHAPTTADGQLDPEQRQVFDNLQRWAIAETHPAQAAFSWTAAQLLELSALLNQGIRATMAEDPNFLAALEESSRAVELLLKVARQSDRLMNVACKLKDAETVSKAKKLQLDTYAQPVGLGRSPPRAPTSIAEAAASAQ